MARKPSARKQPPKSRKHIHKQISCQIGGNGCGGAFYFLGFLGALIYYISTAASFGAGVIGFLKALVWPAFLVFELLAFLGA